MGKKSKPWQKTTQEDSTSSEIKQEELLKTLGDFTKKENWDQFFKIRGGDDSFEWYADWPQLESLLTPQLSFQSEEQLDSAGKPAAEVRILVPGCGNSRLSEHLYDAGFKSITNVDFSKVVISDMLRRNVRQRPEMKWRVMDMTNMQFGNQTFDAIVDKGGLDALMEPKLGPRLGNQYLNEVKRILKSGGKYVCLTLVEAHVLDLLFSKFRFGWKMSLYAIGQETSRNPKLQTFMAVAEKDNSTAISDVSLFMDEYSHESHGNQVRDLREALRKEDKIRLEYSEGADILYSLQDLHLGAKGDLSELQPGRRVKLLLGDGGSHFFYNCVLMDAREDSGPFIYPYGVFLVPQNRSHEWLFTSEQGQWLIVVSSKAARLLMVLLDSSNYNFSMEYIQMDLSPLVKQLTPGDDEDGVQIPFLSAGDGIKQRSVVHQVTSPLTGPIVVEDVIYEVSTDDDDDTKEFKFRRLTFHRTGGLVQSEGLLSISIEVEKDKEQEAHPENKGKPRKSDSHSSMSPASSGKVTVVHNHLASPYHNGIISGILLITSHLKVSTAAGDLVKTVVIGLGAGLLPMFMKNCLPSLKIEVVELDPVVLEVAREYFGFREDECLKVHIADGIKFVKEKAHSKADENSSGKVDILVVDVDSSDTSSGLTCPDPAFVEESFLLTVKDSLSQHGLFILNLVSRSAVVKHGVYSRIKKVFKNVFSLQLEEDVNEVLFAFNSESLVEEDQLFEARIEVAISLELEKEWRQRVKDLSKTIKPLVVPE